MSAEARVNSVVVAGRDLALLRGLADRIDQTDPGAFNNLGVLYHSKGLHADAVAVFMRALALDPRMRTAARNLEIAATHEGACDALLAQLEVRLRDDVHNTEVRRKRAQLFRLIGRRQEATDELDALIADDPDDVQSVFERGLIEQRAGDLRRAQRWFERAARAAPYEPLTRLHLAEVLYQRGQNEQALRTLDVLLAQSPTSADAHLLRGFVLGDMGRHEAAQAAARQASALNPSLHSLQANLSIEDGASATASSTMEVAHPPTTNEPDGALARYGLGLAFRQRGYFDEARREFERAIDLDDDAGLARHAIAELELLSGDFAAARYEYDVLLTKYEDSPRYWNERGVALHQGGDVDGAADSYRRALRRHPRYALAYNNLGVALAHLGEDAAAREAFVRASELDPALIRARLNLSRWHVDHRDPLAALALLRELVAFHPADADAWHAMGTVLQELHRLDDAREALLCAIEFRPDHPEARYALAQVFGLLGDDDGAVRETRHALRLSPRRSESRLTLGIDLQFECPEATGRLDLLSLRARTPLAGVHVDDATVAELLPEPAVTAAAEQGLLAQAERGCDIAEGFALRGLHGEALDRYELVRKLLEPSRNAAPASLQTMWRRAALGEARSRCLTSEGHLAIDVLRQLGAADPDDPEVVALFAAAAAESASRGLSEPGMAKRAMQRLLRMESPSAALLHFVGDAAVRIGETPFAMAFFRRAIVLDPSRPTPRLAIARLLRSRGDLLAARLELVAALSSAPGWRDALLELVHVHRDAGRREDALALLARHVTRAPADFEALLQLVDVLISLDRDADARVVVDRMLRNAPEDQGALWYDAQLLFRQSRVREAINRWTRILAHDGDALGFAAKAKAALSSIADETGLIMMDVDIDGTSTRTSDADPRHGRRAESQRRLSA